MHPNATAVGGLTPVGRINLRIGIDARLWHYQHAGISTYTRGLLRGLNGLLSEKEQVLVLLSQKDKQSKITGAGMAASYLRTPPHHRLEQIGLAVELPWLGLNVVHCPDFIPPMYRNCRSVITVHDLAFLHYPHLLTAESQRYYGQIDVAVKSADSIIAVSNNTKKDLIEKVGAHPEKIFVIPEAADEAYRPLESDHVHAELQHRFGLEPGYLLFVGTLEPRKNLPFLLEAYADLRARWQPRKTEVPKLVIAGRQGWLFQDIFNAVESRGLAEHVAFLGAVTPEDLVILYNGARLLVFPSLYEGFGLPLLEAMACGTPVIGANVSSIPEVVGDAALLFGTGDVEALTGGLERLILDDGLVQSLRQKGFQRVKQFSWEETARQTLDVYRRLAN
jgi:glycosyltransferase involved in cell wall biosynthesis